jgi:hypothetical protein
MVRYRPRLMSRSLSVPIVALLTALIAAPAAHGAPTIVTVNDPAGQRVITSTELHRWDRIYRVLDDEQETRMTPRVRRASVVDLLVQNQWLDAEARAHGVTVGGEQVDAVVESLEDNFPAAVRRKAGLTRDDLRLLTRVNLVAQALEEHAEGPAAASVTDAAIDAEIAKEGPRFEPEQRDVRYLGFRDRATAARARKALRRGTTWSQVARRYAGGNRPFVLRRLAEGAPAAMALEHAPFGARRGQPSGPVKDGSRYFVFEVLRIRPREQVPMERHRALVRDELVDAAEEQLAATWATAYRATWKARTVCADAFAFYPGCGNWDGTTVRGVEWIAGWR